MKKINLLPAIIISLIIFSGCSQVKIITEHDKNSEFSSYKTFMFLPWIEINSELLEDIDEEMFFSSIEKELSARGYTKVAKNADMAVNLMVIVEKGTAYSGYGGYYNYAGYGYYYPFGIGYSTVRYQSFENLNGTLVIDLFDQSKKTLLWQGVAIGEAKEESKSREQKVDKVVSRMFRNYPVKKKN
jgi:hypothetical protein